MNAGVAYATGVLLLQYPDGTEDELPCPPSQLREHLTVLMADPDLSGLVPHISCLLPPIEDFALLQMWGRLPKPPQVLPPWHPRKPLPVHLQSEHSIDLRVSRFLPAPPGGRRTKKKYHAPKWDTFWGAIRSQ